MAKKAQTPEQLAAMRERMRHAQAASAAARAAGTAKKRTRKPKAPPPDPVWSFRIDHKGELNIVDTNDESGVTLDYEHAALLRDFLVRSLNFALNVTQNRP